MGVGEEGEVLAGGEGFPVAVGADAERAGGGGAGEAVFGGRLSRVAER